MDVIAKVNKTNTRGQETAKINKPLYIYLNINIYTLESLYYDRLILRDGCSVQIIKEVTTIDPYSQKQRRSLESGSLPDAGVYTKPPSVPP